MTILANMRKFVTRLQCLVFRLPACNAPVCWPDRDEYSRHIGRRTT